ncbi:MAG: AtpZ/AtpI family protein [Chloroflexi bacterium]|nr:AtpZ/AtpI family protein [Chloroflexota bacterium]MCI0649439.1 AtpZ/AtpI family protein [Chloroflexota bacterium]MCI0730761.1 AtpZ/AtpI family protein [Chloroflexota bacterium]
MNQDDQINQTAMLAGIVGQIGCITVIIIALALGAGIAIDRLLDTKPVFTILFMIGSVPVTLFVTVRVSLMAAARAQRLAAKDKPKEGP